MSATNHKSPVLDGCSVLPPLEPTERQHLQPIRAAGKAAATKGAGNRFQTINNFADFTLEHLSRAEIAVWLLLWRDTKRDGLVRTSQADLARRAGVSPRTVERTVPRLQKAGLLTVVYRGGLRRGPSKYRVHPLIKKPQSDTSVGL